MKIALLGATRGTGRCVLDQALERNHDVVALARDPSKLPQHPRLGVVEGDARSLEDQTKALTGAEAVISCLGSGQLNKADYMVTACIEPTLAAMEHLGVRRLIFLSSIGVGDSKNLLMKAGAPLFKLVARSAYEIIFEDKERSEAKIVQAENIDWTIVRPGKLHDGPRKGRYEAAASKGGTHFWGRISRADLATFLIDEAQNARWLRGMPTVWA